jgi:hypothetical protein
LTVSSVAAVTPENVRFGRDRRAPYDALPRPRPIRTGNSPGWVHRFSTPRPPEERTSRTLRGRARRIVAIIFFDSAALDGDDTVSLDATRDGRRFLLRQPAGTDRPAITVVVNWTEKIKNQK